MFVDGSLCLPQFDNFLKTDMKHMLDECCLVGLYWVLTVCQSTHSGVTSLQKGNSDDSMSIILISYDEKTRSI